MGHAEGPALVLAMVLGVLALAPPPAPAQPLPVQTPMQSAMGAVGADLGSRPEARDTSADTASRTAAAAPASAAMEAALRQMRTQHRLPAYQSLPDAQRRAALRYMEALLTPMLSGSRCDHDRARWQRFLAELANGSLITTSEVLACPTAANRWDPARVVALWLRSPVHRGILLQRPRTTHAACLVGERQGRVAAVCTLWRPSG